MAIRECVDRAMKQWAKQERNKLSPAVRRLIAMAKYDLYFGPLSAMGDGDEPYQEETSPGSGIMVKWEGFSEACDRIREALDSLHTSDVWVDIQFEGVFTDKPEGEYVENPDYDRDDPESEEKVWEEPCWEDIYHVDAKQVLGYLVGELAEYL